MRNRKKVFGSRMKDIGILILIMSFAISCSLFSKLTGSLETKLYAKDIERAKQLEGGEYIVTDSSLEQMRSGGPKVTSACDLSLGFSKAEQTSEKFSFCIYKDHSAFSDYASLRAGDRVKFEFVENILQRGGSGPREVSFLLVHRLYR